MNYQIELTLEFRDYLNELTNNEQEIIVEFIDKVKYQYILQDLIDTQVIKHISLNYYQVKVGRFFLVIKYKSDKELRFMYSSDSFLDENRMEYKWYDVYEYLAGLLSDYYSSALDKKEVSLSLMCELKERSRFFEVNDWAKNKLTIDPFDIFLSVSARDLEYVDRIDRLNVLFEFFTGDELVFKNVVDFTCRPVMYFAKNRSERTDLVQESTWDLLYKVVNSLEVESELIESIIDSSTLDLKAISQLLFWLGSRDYVSLDKITLSYLDVIYDDEVGKKTAEYLLFCHDKNTNRYKDYVWDSREKSDSKSNKTILFDDYINGKASACEEDKKPYKSDLSISVIAIRPMKGCSSEFLSTLTEDEYYILDDSFSFNDDLISNSGKENVSIYNQDDVNVNISAIVGRNGTGKSSLIELLHVMINNFYYKSEGNNIDIRYVNGVYSELYFKLDGIYKLSIKNEEIEIVKYNEGEDGYLNPIITNEKHLELSRFFYTISVNYSQHAMNCSNDNAWLNKLFHKNDAYQTPLVIEPFRDKGNIDINRQEVLVKRRLLNNLLEIDSGDSKIFSHRNISEFYKADRVKLKLNINKINVISNGVMVEEYEDEIVETILLFRRVFSIGISSEPKTSLDTCKTLIDYAEIYIFKKLVNICLTYSGYKKYFCTENNKFKHESLKDFLNVLKDDDSHITYKLNQAANFISHSYESFYHKEPDKESVISLEEYSGYISERIGVGKSKNINFVPPSFFDVDFISDKGVEYKTLSSGEKQKIYTLNSIYYHLNNISSVSDDMVKYSHVNIVLDEVELYYHPELQRLFITDFLTGLRGLELKYVNSINVIFVTHSPFIISDIQESKILFLDRNETGSSLKVESCKKIKTLGANIHDLLISGFFMKNSIGEFSHQKICDIVDFHRKVVSDTGISIEQLRSEFSSNEQIYEYIVSNIGEDYIKGVLQDHLDEIKERLLISEDNKVAKINELQRRIDVLKGLHHDSN